MALTVDLDQTDLGTALTGCYLRIVKLQADKTWLRIEVEAHVNETARVEGRLPVLTSSHAVASSAVTGTLFPALYAHLKTLPEYAGAQDC